MARVYTSRQLFDPNLIAMMNQQNQNAATNQLNRDKMMGDSVRNMLGGIGKAVDSAYDDYKTKQAQKQRYDEVMGQATIAQQADPLFMAAARDYAREGNANSLTSYQLGKEAAEAKKAAAAQSKATQDWHDRNQKMAAEDNYENYRKEALAAQDKGDYATAEYLLNKANRLKNEWAERGYDIGEDFGSILDAAKRAKEEAAEKKRLEEIEAKKAEDRETNRLLNVENEKLNIRDALDNAQTKEQRRAILASIQDPSKWPSMTEKERLELQKELSGQKTLSERKQEARDAAHVQKTGEATGKSIDEAEYKKKAKDYDGKKMSKRQYDALDENVRQYITIDGQGIAHSK